MRPRPRADGDLVTGLGASNPKGHAACVIDAPPRRSPEPAAGIPLPGDLVAGFGAGGMPTNARPGGATGATPARASGCSFLLEQGVWTDAR